MIAVRCERGCYRISGNSRRTECALARRRLPAASALMSAARGNADSFCSARAFPSLTRSGLTQRTKIFAIRSRRRRNRYTEIYFDVVAPCGLSFLVSLPHQIGHSATGRGAPAVDNELSAGGVGGEVGAEEEHH